MKRNGPSRGDRRDEGATASVEVAGQCEAAQQISTSMASKLPAETLRDAVSCRDVTEHPMGWEQRCRPVRSPDPGAISGGSVGRHRPTSPHPAVAVTLALA